MPLSEHEQRMLDQIESALYAEDPKFASNVRGSKLRTASSKRRIQAIVILVIGLALLVGGLLLPGAALLIVSPLGFLTMFIGGVYLLWGGRQRPNLGVAQEDGTVRPPESGSGQPRSGQSAKGPGFGQRMEERFRKRFDDPNS